MALLINVLASGVVDASGNPLDSGKAYIYEVGTTTPVTAYQDAELSLPHSNPIVLNSVGKAEAYVNQDVRVLIEDANGTTIDDIDAIGTNTALTNEILTIGGSSSDILELNSSIRGNVNPINDNQYTVGTDTKRWKEGHFVDLYGDIKGGKISRAGALTPGWISNLGISYSGSTVTITAADGTPLSTSNPGYVTVPSTTGGQLVTLKVTSGGSFVDDTGSSNLTNKVFGITSGSDWNYDCPFFIYAINKGNSDIDGVDGHSFFGIARVWTMKTTSSNSALVVKNSSASANNVGCMMILGDVTLANYLSLPIQLIGSFRMQWSSSTTDWTVQSLGATDGLGQQALDRTFATLWRFPVGQNNAATGTHILTNGGTAPIFSTLEYYYAIYRNEMVTLFINMSGDGGTDGSGAVQTQIAAPYDPETGASAPWLGIVATTSATGGNAYTYARLASTARIDLYTTTAFNTFNLSNFTNGGRSINGVLTYRMATST